MKFLKYLVIIFFTTVLSTKSFSTDSIVYLDINMILANSTAGKNASNDLEAKFKKETIEFNKIGEKLKEDEAKIIAQKNILSEEEYLKKINELRTKVKEYRINRKKILDEITNERLSLSKKFIELINPIIAEYALKNSISLVIEKKNILIGKTDLDITDKILLIVNEKISKINLK